MALSLHKVATWTAAPDIFQVSLAHQITCAPSSHDQLTQLISNMFTTWEAKNSVFSNWKGYSKSLKVEKNSLQQRNHQEAPYEASMNHQYKASTRSNQSSHDVGWLFTISGLHLLAHRSSEKNRSCTSISSRESDGSFWLQSPRYTIQIVRVQDSWRLHFSYLRSPGHNLRPPCNRRPAGVPSLRQGTETKSFNHPCHIKIQILQTVLKLLKYSMQQTPSSWFFMVLRFVLFSIAKRYDIISEINPWHLQD